jgi:hypothetical protein
VNSEIFNNIPDDAINGDKIHGGTISSFSSVGISDLATKPSLIVTDGRIVVDTVRTSSIEGNINLDGSIDVKKSITVKENSIFDQDVYVGNDLSVSGEIRAVTIHVDNLISKNSNELKEPVNWSVDSGGIEGKGLIFKRSKKEIDVFIYKSDPSRIYTNLDIDLYRGNNFCIDGNPVLSVDTLGPGISKSSLRKIGKLENLEVAGDIIFSEHIFFNSKSRRLGIGTNKASTAFSLVDKGIELAMGSLYEGVGNFGTFTSHDFGIITDNVQRVKFGRTGKIEFGDSVANNADIMVHGKLYVKELIVDQRNERTGPLEFKAAPNATNYGRGIQFTGHGNNKQFILAAEPDQFFSTENINLQAEKGYLIDNKPVLTIDSLGPTVTNSSLTRVGTLNYLHVQGEVNLNESFKIKDNKVLIGDAEIDTRNGLKIIGSSFELKTTSQSIAITDENIFLGSKDRPTVNAVVNGKLSIGMQSVGDNAQLEVAGGIRFADKLFMVGNKAPVAGTFRKGDIVWNNEPRETGYVGWICVREGNPGIWRGFGQIGVE